MQKTDILQLIIAQLTQDLDVLFGAAKTAHEASIHEENIPDNKYDTLGLEASYVAQGQANRAQEIRQSLEAYKQLSLQVFSEDEEIRLTALVTLEAADGITKIFFLGPREGGLKVTDNGADILVITPGSPLGSDLLGKVCGDTVMLGSGGGRTEYQIVEVC